MMCQQTLIINTRHVLKQTPGRSRPGYLPGQLSCRTSHQSDKGVIDTSLFRLIWSNEEESAASRSAVPSSRPREGFNGSESVFFIRATQEQ